MNQNNYIKIDMPPGCRYMSDDNRLMNGILPLHNKFILNKTLTGCGGTSMFLNSNMAIVIISPRIQVLKEKHKQHPDSFLFHIPQCNNRGSTIKQKESELNTYLNNHHGYSPFGFQTRPAKILVTLDSSDKVVSVIESCGGTDPFLFVVDEFQCIMGDATFKGTTDMNFLVSLDNRVKRICYLSATPIPDMYLDEIPQLASIQYYKLEWDPSVIEEPTLKEVMMKTGESAEKLCSQLIKRYRENGYFEKKIVNGNIVYSREACIFLNEVKSIRNIIKQNELKPEEVTILCSESKASNLPKGFTIGGLCTDKNNPKNKTFTFCTKASFEGVDFYSDNASTYIFINAGRECQTLDIMLDIPQILGRQRLDSNPFRHDATIYYKTMPEVKSEEDFRIEQNTMISETKNSIELFKKAPSEYQNKFVKLYEERDEEKKFKTDYVDLIKENGHTTVGFNYLVMVAKWNQWHQRNFYYNNSCQLLTSIQSAVGMRQKPNEVRQFEQWFYKASQKDRLAGYADFRNQYPQHYSFIQQNPFIDCKYHEWYDNLGYQKLKNLNFQEANVERAYQEHCQLDPIRDACRQMFKVGVFYSKQEVKSILQQIYNDLGLIGKTAKATDLRQYLDIKEVQKTDDSGERKWFITLINTNPQV